MMDSVRASKGDEAGGEAHGEWAGAGDEPGELGVGGGEVRDGVFGSRREACGCAERGMRHGRMIRHEEDWAVHDAKSPEASADSNRKPRV